MLLSLPGATFSNYQIFALITTGFTWGGGGIRRGREIWTPEWREDNHASPMSLQLASSY
jgi:hypothetical protein